MEYLDRYRKKLGAGQPSAAGNPFIEMALNKVLIHKYVSGETDGDGHEAVLIFRDKEGPDNGILYTYKDDGLEIGDTIVKKGSTKESNVYYLIVEEVKRVDGSKVIRVFNVLETNVLFRTKEQIEKLPAYLISNIRKGVRDSSRDGVSLELKKAVMVAPKTYKIRLDNKLNIENLITEEESYASWLVEGIDDVSTPHINYIHLTQVLKEDFDKEEKPIAPPQDEDGEDIEVVDTLVALSSLTLATHAGYIKTTPSATLLKRAADEIVIQVPYEEGLFVVEVKNELGEIVEYKYNVRR